MYLKINALNLFWRVGAGMGSEKEFKILNDIDGGASVGQGEKTGMGKKYKYNILK